ncbi:hypothetical protein [Desulfosporosinus lacus]|uniref:Uncharacterized protein n=1 Tax=Desulfosporosinus lacus DSM 15449 TaxID=1121420 RepID=A0A1M6DNL6_9FIRM|nr:hypothetical protein [Desulfosporosinus lacus]SHI74826.1 hypothetical protein SAMN02746098_04574 [Desulfosporosinus lacus DSM 15449]
MDDSLFGVESTGDTVVDSEAEFCVLSGELELLVADCPEESLDNSLFGVESTGDTVVDSEAEFCVLSEELELLVADCPEESVDDSLFGVASSDDTCAESEEAFCVLSEEGVFLLLQPTMENIIIRDSKIADIFFIEILLSCFEFLTCLTDKLRKGFNAFCRKRFFCFTVTGSPPDIGGKSYELQLILLSLIRPSNFLDCSYRMVSANV